MCRYRQAAGVALAAFGAGLLLGSFFGSFWLGLVGAAALAAGILLARRRC